MRAHILRGKLQNENFARSIQNILKNRQSKPTISKVLGFLFSISSQRNLLSCFIVTIFTHLQSK